MSAKILLAEDEEHIAKLVQFKLTKAGLDFTWAQNGQEAYDQIKTGQFGLLILDIMMPVMDGWTLISRLSAEHFKPFPRILMLSARGFQHDLGMAAKLGIRHYLKKPFDPGEMLETVKKILQEPMPNG